MAILMIGSCSFLRSGDDAMLFCEFMQSISVQYLSNEINGRNKVINFIFGTLSNRIFYRLINDGQIIIGKVFVLFLLLLLCHHGRFISSWLSSSSKKEIHSILLFSRYENPTIFYSFLFHAKAKPKKPKIPTSKPYPENEDITSSKNKRRRIYLIEMEHFCIYIAIVYTRLSQRFM